MGAEATPNPAIDTVKKIADALGVPISFLDKYNPEQFEILGLDDHRIKYPDWRGRGPDLNGNPIYKRIIIKSKKVKK